MKKHNRGVFTPIFRLFHKIRNYGTKQMHFPISGRKKALHSIAVVVTSAAAIGLLAFSAGCARLRPDKAGFQDGSQVGMDLRLMAAQPEAAPGRLISPPATAINPPPHTPIPAVPSAPPTDTPVPTPFSIVWLSDTQSMTYCNYTDALESMGRWIVDEKQARNILYVVQTGDAVENGFSDWQWKNFDACYDQFRDELPYIAIAGNHETGMKRHSYVGYLSRRNVSEIPRRYSFERGRAAYATLRAGGIDFLILGAGWDSELMSVDWMNEVLREHRDFVAILLFHGYIQTNGTYTVVGKKMFEQVVKPNPNVKLVLCGHVLGTAVRFEDVDDNGDGAADRRVTALMYNYQNADTDCGQLRLLTFDPMARSMRVLTYSPYQKRYYRDYTYSSSDFLLDNVF